VASHMALRDLTLGRGRFSRVSFKRLCFCGP